MSYPQWEYEIIRASEGTDLNFYGSAGWELCGVMPVGSGSVYLYFKRPKGEIKGVGTSE